MLTQLSADYHVINLYLSNIKVAFVVFISFMAKVFCSPPFNELLH